MIESDPELSSTTAIPEPPTDATPSPLAARLPPTILSQVFELLHDDCERDGSLEWLQASSHVCQHWRAHALGHQSLWTSLNPMILSRGLVDDFLERSEDAPLEVDVHALPNGNDRELRQAYRRVLTRELHRVRTLMYAHTDAERQFVPAAEELALLLKEPAPLLHTLRLPALKRSRLLFREAGVLLNFLTNHAPALQRLELTRFPPSCFPWGSPPPAIRTLVLCIDNPIEGVLSVSFTQVLDGLRAMPNLRTLSLSGMVPRRTVDDNAQVTVNLPHLQKLRLTGSGEQYAQLWCALKLHPECAAQIEIIHSADFPEILPNALKKHFIECDISSFQELHVKRNASNGVVYDLYPLSRPPNEYASPSHPYTHPYLSLFVSWENKMKTPHAPAVQIFDVTPLRNVKRITIEAVDAARTDPERMARLDQRVGAVEDLVLVAYRPSQLSSMFLLLGRSLLSTPSEEGDDVCMPHLRTITLKQCHFDREVAGPALRYTLERRAQECVPKLDSLSFVGCGLEMGRVDELEVELVESGLVKRILSDDEAGRTSAVTS
ncbi:unnamed protein product [Peniophora sp. CBMAI 1063]|nr:unnamed protein product [Peniophora sp. CBMAI 1063]